MRVSGVIMWSTQRMSQFFLRFLCTFHPSSSATSSTTGYWVTEKMRTYISRWWSPSLSLKSNPASWAAMRTPAFWGKLSWVFLLRRSTLTQIIMNAWAAAIIRVNKTHWYQGARDPWTLPGSASSSPHPASSPRMVYPIFLFHLSRAPWSTYVVPALRNRVWCFSHFQQPITFSRSSISISFFSINESTAVELSLPLSENALIKGAHIHTFPALIW